MPLQRSLVLEKKRVLRIREIELNDTLGDDDCRVRMHSVGICGSDVHYYEHGYVGPFVVKEPMVLGHEASGTVSAVGKNVTHLHVGDRVALEPGIPCWHSRETLSGIYNVDPKVKFFATPPVHGCLSPTVIHPAALCFKLPDNVSYAEGAMCEPIAVGMHGATKAGIKPGDIAFVAGAGTIGIVTALSALAGGCAKVIICDPFPERLQLAGRYPGIYTVSSNDKDAVSAVVTKHTDGHGCNVLFECSGAQSAYPLLTEYAAPGATAVLIGMPVNPVTWDPVSAQVKEITYQTVFRYRNVYPKILALLSAGKLNVKPLISATFSFADSIKAYERALQRHPKDIKLIIQVDAPDAPSSKI